MSDSPLQPAAATVPREPARTHTVAQVASDPRRWGHVASPRRSLMSRWLHLPFLMLLAPLLVLLPVSAASVAQASAPITATVPLVCPHNTVPGWLDSNGNPTSCVGDAPCPETLGTPLNGDCPASKPKSVYANPASCAVARQFDYAWWKADRLCQSFVSKVSPKAKTYTVHWGDALWCIAVRAYGHGTCQHAGQQYRLIMRLNHLRTTRLHVGQVLRLR